MSGAGLPKPLTRGNAPLRGERAIADVVDMAALGPSFAAKWPCTSAKSAFGIDPMSSACRPMGKSATSVPVGNPRQLMAYLGLVPSEHTSGSSVRRGVTGPHEVVRVEC